MKKFTTLLILFIFIAYTANAQLIPNNDFENWTNNKLDNWDISNFTTAGTNFTTVTQSTDAISGEFAVKLESVRKVVGFFPVTVPGVITLGELIISQTDPNIVGGIPFNQKPIKLKGHFKATPKKNDKAVIGIGLTKWNENKNLKDTIAGGYLFIAESVTEWTEFSIDIDWFKNIEPDTMNIVISSSNLETQEFENGSVIWVDKLELVFESICPDNIHVCANAQAFELSGAKPENGTYSGKGVENGIFDPTVAGIGEHIITYEHELCDENCTFKIFVEEFPNVDFEYSNNELVYAFTNKSEGGNTYFWDFGDNNNSIEENPTHAYSKGGTYDVSLTVSNNYCESTKTEGITVNSDTGIELLDLNFSVHPNPTKRDIHIQSTDIYNEITIAITDINGKNIYQKSIENSKCNIEVSLEHYPNGTYFVNIIADGNHSIYKVMRTQ